MLSAEEINMLRWLTARYYRGDGCIVDAGAFLGGSTVALARGLEDARMPATTPPQIRSYDMFLAPRNEASLQMMGRQRKPGDNVLDIYQQNLGELGRYVEVNAGDFLEQRVPSEPIEILFVDIAKTAKLNEHLVKNYYSRMIPNQSILVHQDYNFAGVPWIQISMQYLADYLVPIVDQPMSRLFYLAKRIPEDVLLFDPFNDASREERLAWMDAVVDQERDNPALSLIELSRAFLIFLDFGADKALEEMARIESEHSHISWFPEILTGIRSSVQHQKGRAGFEDYCNSFFEPY